MLLSFGMACLSPPPSYNVQPSFRLNERHPCLFMSYFCFSTNVHLCKEPTTLNRIFYFKVKLSIEPGGLVGKILGQQVSELGFNERHPCLFMSYFCFITNVHLCKEPTTLNRIFYFQIKLSIEPSGLVGKILGQQVSELGFKSQQLAVCWFFLYLISVPNGRPKK